MGVAERKEREKESLRQEIIDAAREIFVAEGYDRLSMRKVAERIEYSPTTIYLYFDDKADLLREVCEQSFTKLGDSIQKARRKKGPPLEVLRRGLFAYIEFGLANPHHYEVAFISPEGKIFDTDAYEFEGSAGQRAFEMLVASVKDCVEAGEIRVKNVALAAQMLWAAIHGVTSLLIMHRDFPFVDRKVLVRSVVETSIKGLQG
ncbi:MAG: TetR/AcrR family transcriptional regulator [Pyrinomonadaceae bacterium]|nr:TetR/AcrR family transcriptional regulator [Pyrinomonadaceae bacterium]